MSSEKRSADALGGKTARPCDSCLCKRARWYCAADDAFLCQACDSSVHSANPLARRHERLSLKTAFSSLRSEPLPSWIHGFRRKARTPRHSKPSAAKAEPAQIPLLVPELSSGDDPSPLDEEQLLYQVPIFHPVADAIIPAADSIPKPTTLPDQTEQVAAATAADYMTEFGTCDEELAADVESLLGNGLEDDSFCMEALGLMETGEGDMVHMEWRVKNEETDEAGIPAAAHVGAELDQSCDTLDLKFGCESPTTTMTCDGEEEEEVEKKVFLRLDYEAVMTAWASQGLPWTTGDRPDFNPDDCWPDWTGMCVTEHQQYQVGGPLMMGDRGREARVSRYREKRRNRLFSKKIRYEVRKLNAEKRPRMKGRFVKRASMLGPSTAFPF